MAVYGYHEQPDVLEFDTEVIDSRPGAIVLARSLLHPGGGGQVSDRAELQSAAGVGRHRPGRVRRGAGRLERSSRRATIGMPLLAVDRGVYG